MIVMKAKSTGRLKRRTSRLEPPYRNGGKGGAGKGASVCV